MATFRQRSKTSWEAQVRMRGWPAQTRTFPTKADAQRWAAERETELHRGTFVDRSSLRHETLGSLLERYLCEVTPSKKGSEVESFRIRSMMRESMASMTLDRLSSSVIRDWREVRKKIVKGETVRREMNLLSNVFKVAAAEWDVPVVNPVSGLSRPAQSQGRERRPTWAELKNLLRELDVPTYTDGTYAGARNEWVRPAVLFALRTAMRRGEILKIQWRDVHYDERYVRVLDPKNGESRSVPLSRRAEAILRRLPRGAPGDRVFPLSASSLKQVFSRAMKRAGVVDLRFHDFRHEAATQFAARLPNVLELSAVTGHKSLSMLKRYFNPKPAALASKLD